MELILNKSEDGILVPFKETKNGQLIPVASLRSVRDEADAWVNHFLRWILWADHLVVFGMGGGFHVVRLIERVFLTELKNPNLKSQVEFSLEKVNKKISIFEFHEDLLNYGMSKVQEHAQYPVFNKYISFSLLGEKDYLNKDFSEMKQDFLQRYMVQSSERLAFLPFRPALCAWPEALLYIVKNSKLEQQEYLKCINAKENALSRIYSELVQCRS